MEYAAYKFSFSAPVHFGQRTLTSHEMTFSADRLFSALCIEALKKGEETLSQLLTLAKDNTLIFSDAFPYSGDNYYFPKPIFPVKRTNNDEDIKTRKIFKKINYLAIDKFDKYLKGEAEAESLKLPKFGESSVKTSVKVDPTVDPEPYRVGLFSFEENCGLYIIVGYEKKGKTLAETLLESLSFAGIGGKRSAGLGRFELLPGKVSDETKKRLTDKYQTYMTISATLPTDEELPMALDGATYLLSKRGGFVASVDYADEWRKKKDSFVFAAGSCFKNTFTGQIKDVSDGGNHPVYRYLKPMFLGVN
ncbi:MAG: type III-A CRISPR-associated RAMP protein Csm4 [Selenomonadaceae bacterium]|nr:type III-A CRISPR-associated RAMP protein Csm4 [Selenomonadaceae bacterium]